MVTAFRAVLRHPQLAALRDEVLERVVAENPPAAAVCLEALRDEANRWGDAPRPGRRQLPCRQTSRGRGNSARRAAISGMNGLDVELGNVSDENPLELRWRGRPAAGFLEFRLLDTRGVEVPRPEWALGGNEITGEFRVVIPPRGSVRLMTAQGIFETAAGRRLLRIGAFRAREMPEGGPRRFLAVRLAGRGSIGPGAAQIHAEGSDGGLRIGAPGANLPSRPAWVGTLDLRPVCIE